MFALLENTMRNGLMVWVYHIIGIGILRSCIFLVGIVRHIGIQWRCPDIADSYEFFFRKGKIIFKIFFQGKYFADQIVIGNKGFRILKIIRT